MPSFCHFTCLKYLLFHPEENINLPLYLQLINATENIAVLLMSWSIPELPVVSKQVYHSKEDSPFLIRVYLCL